MVRPGTWRIAGRGFGRGDDVHGHAAVVRQERIARDGWGNGGRLGRRARRGIYLCDCPTDRPKLISPLSMRKLKPQSGLLHTHAL